MSGKVVLFPNSNMQAVGRSLDPNLARLFTGDELYDIWDELEILAVNRVRELFAKSEDRPFDFSGHPSEKFVAQIAAFFLKHAAERTITRPACMPLPSKPRP